MEVVSVQHNTLTESDELEEAIVLDEKWNFIIPYTEKIDDDMKRKTFVVSF